MPHEQFRQMKAIIKAALLISKKDLAPGLTKSHSLTNLAETSAWEITTTYYVLMCSNSIKIQ